MMVTKDLLNGWYFALVGILYHQQAGMKLAPMIEKYSRRCSRKEVNKMAVEAQEVFDGVMLSDGNLQMHGFNARLRVQLSGASHLDWLTYIKDALLPSGVQIGARGLGLYKGISKGKPYIGAFLQTRTCSYLTEQCERWYKAGIKVVPVDVKITPLSIANWFMGDGSSSPDNRNSAIVTHLASCNFTLEECIILAERLEVLGVRATAAPNNGYPRVNISQFSVNYFMSIIEEYIQPSYRYKVKSRLNEPVSNKKNGGVLWR